MKTNVIKNTTNNFDLENYSLIYQINLEQPIKWTAQLWKSKKNNYLPYVQVWKNETYNFHNLCNVETALTWISRINLDYKNYQIEHEDLFSDIVQKNINRQILIQNSLVKGCEIHFIGFSPCLIISKDIIERLLKEKNLDTKKLDCDPYWLIDLNSWDFYSNIDNFLKLTKKLQSKVQ